jgi:hypothetical protein
MARRVNRTRNGRGTARKENPRTVIAGAGQNPLPGSPGKPEQVILKIGEGGLRIDDPAIIRQAQEIAKDNPDALVEVYTSAAPDGPSVELAGDGSNITVHNLTVNNPAVVEAIRKAPDPEAEVGRLLRSGAREMERRRLQGDPATLIQAGDNICPRCGGGIPTDMHKGQYQGARSHTDNRTEICSGCGTDEAMENIAGCLTPKDRWPVVRRPWWERQPGGFREAWDEVRGGVREPRTPIPTPKEVPDLRLHLMEQWHEDGPFTRAIMARSHDTAVSALDSTYERETLRTAGLWWVRDEMVGLVAQAAKSVPAEMKAKELKLPAGQDSGLAVLAKPYVGSDAAQPDKTVKIDVICWGRSRLGNNVPCLSVSMYRFFDFPGGLSGADLQEAINTGAIYGALASRLTSGAVRLSSGAWVYMGRADWPLENELDSFRQMEGATLSGEPMDERRQASIIEDRRFFAALCVLVDHKLSQSDIEHADRHVWKRAHRARVGATLEETREISKVRIIRLREVPSRAGETAEDRRKRDVEWSHRWFVEGRFAWRRCGPGHADRRWTFISPYIKGPKDRPLILKENVHVWVR